MSFPTNRWKGRGKGRKQHIPGQMNSLEKAYATYLEGLKSAGQILWYAFDCIKLRLAEKTFYTPDFLVMLPSFDLEIHETKGFWEDDARVKIKVAADKFPLKFVGITKEKGLWVREEFS